MTGPARCTPPQFIPPEDAPIPWRRRFLARIALDSQPVQSQVVNPAPLWSLDNAVQACLSVPQFGRDVCRAHALTNHSAAQHRLETRTAVRNQTITQTPSQPKPTNCAFNHRHAPCPLPFRSGWTTRSTPKCRARPDHDDIRSAAKNRRDSSKRILAELRRTGLLRS
jgi:hypothetical protein